MKAHLVFHQLISDVTAPKYVFLTYLSRHYATANRSSVDSTTFDIISDYRNFNQQNALPNLAHSIPLYMERNRLISDYNRYLRERILHYRFLRMDPIREKIDGTSLVDTPHRHKLHLPETSVDLLNQIQCSVQQIRLILACMFSSETLNHPLYSYCYGLVAMDLSILFRFLNLALVAALQNFFSLPRDCAEKTLFAYKEYTQLQLAEEVHSFVSLGPNAVSVKDLDIPGPLRQDDMAVRQLTKSLEDFLYNPKDNKQPTAAIPAAAAAQRRNLSDSSISKSGSSSTISSSSTTATSSRSVATSSSVTAPGKSNISNARNNTAGTNIGIASKNLTINVPNANNLGLQQPLASPYSPASSTSSSVVTSPTSPGFEIPRKSRLRDAKSVPNLIPARTTSNTTSVPSGPSSSNNSNNSSNGSSTNPRVRSNSNNNAPNLYSNKPNEFKNLDHKLAPPSKANKGAQWVRHDSFTSTEGDTVVYDLQANNMNGNRSTNPYNKPGNLIGSDATLRKQSITSSSVYDDSSLYSVSSHTLSTPREQGRYNSSNAAEERFSNYSQGPIDSPNVNSNPGFGSNLNPSNGVYQSPAVPALSSAVLTIGDIPETKPLGTIPKNASAKSTSTTSTIIPNNLSNRPIPGSASMTSMSSVPSAPPNSALPLPPPTAGGANHANNLHLLQSHHNNNASISSFGRGSNVSGAASGYRSSASTGRYSTNNNSSISSLGSSIVGLENGNIMQQKSYVDPATPTSTQTIVNSTSSSTISALEKPHHSRTSSQHGPSKSITSTITITAPISTTPPGAASPLDPGYTSYSTPKYSKEAPTVKLAPNFAPLTKPIPLPKDDRFVSKNVNSKSHSQKPAPSKAPRGINEPEYPEGFDPEDTSIENWQKLFNTLDNSEATFSLKFDLAAALRRTIEVHDKLAQANGTAGTGAPGTTPSSVGGSQTASVPMTPSSHNVTNIPSGRSSEESKDSKSSTLSPRKFRSILGSKNNSIEMQRSESEEAYQKYSSEYRKNMLKGSNNLPRTLNPPVSNDSYNPYTDGPSSTTISNRNYTTDPKNRASGYMTNITPALEHSQDTYDSLYSGNSEKGSGSGGRYPLYSNTPNGLMFEKTIKKKASGILKTFSRKA